MSVGIILVTGFGPFGSHKINASWETVKRLPQKIENYEIVRKEIPVDYKTVDSIIPNLWETLKPDFVIHIGVSSIANTLVIEKCAERSGYIKKDICGKLPDDNQCLVQGSKCIQTQVNVDQLSSHISSTMALKTCCSEDAGRYLCEYTYYTSLSIDNSKVLFVHVPPLNEPYSVEQLTSGVSEIIRFIIRNVLDKSKI